MKKTYQISGMSCQGCRSHVEKILNKTKGVKNAVVNLEKKEAIIDADQNLSVEELQMALSKDGGNYSISE